MQMFAPPGVNAVTSATTGQAYTVAPGGSINAQVADVPDLLSRGFTFVRMPFTLAQSGTPVILPSSGSSNASGQITLTTALPYQPSGTVSLYLPAGVVTAGSQGSGAGVYQVQFSSTTVCQLVGTGIVTANGAYTQTTGSSIALAVVQVPGGAMGPNGSVRVDHLYSAPNNANSKTTGTLFAGQNFTANGGSTANSVRYMGLLRNRGSQQIQINGQVQTAIGPGNGLTSLSQYGVDTSQPQPITFVGQIAVATDFLILEGYTVEVLPG